MTIKQISVAPVIVVWTMLLCYTNFSDTEALEACFRLLDVMWCDDDDELKAVKSGPAAVADRRPVTEASVAWSQRRRVCECWLVEGNTAVHASGSVGKTRSWLDPWWPPAADTEIAKHASSLHSSRLEASLDRRCLRLGDVYGLRRADV